MSFGSQNGEPDQAIAGQLLPSLAKAFLGALIHITHITIAPLELEGALVCKFCFGISDIYRRFTVEGGGGVGPPFGVRHTLCDLRWGGSVSWQEAGQPKTYTTLSCSCLLQGSTS